MKICAALFALIMFSTPLHAEYKLDSIKQWLDVLPEVIDQQSKTSSNYIKNYLQCMDDEQALRNESDTSIKQLLNDALASGNECSYLLEGMVDELTGPIENKESTANQALHQKSL